jgi:hypothetical protein
VDDDGDNLAERGGLVDAKLLNKVEPLVDDVVVGPPDDAAAVDEVDEGCRFLAPSFNFSHLSLYLFINASCFLF